MISTAQSELERSVRFLARRDSQISQAVKDFGMPATRRQPPGFSTLAKTVVGQQISTSAATAIWKRLKKELGTVNASRVLETPDSALGTAGLSAGKIKTLNALANSIVSGNVNLRKFNRQSDADIKSSLTSVWGIGDWTAEIYLMFGMGRPDVWPAGDLALRTGWQALNQSKQRINASDLAGIALKWRPHRTAAAVLLWHVVAATR